MDYYIKQLQKNIATVNIFDATCQKIIDYKHNNIYTTEIHTILKVHAGQCTYKYLYYKNIDDDAFDNIINIINNLCSDYNINYNVLCKIFNLLGCYSPYDEIGTIDYILECIFILNNDYKTEINYDLLYDPELKLFLDFYDEIYNADYVEQIDTLIRYFYNTDLRDSFLQSYAVNLIEKMHADTKYFLQQYNIRYLNHLIQHLSSSLLLNITSLDNLYDYLFDNEYDLFLDIVTFDRFNEYEYEYCQHNNINYSDYVIDYANNKLISLKK